MSDSRDHILNKLRAVRRPFPDAPPRPKTYLPVTVVEDKSPEALLARFKEEAERLFSKVHLVSGDAAARACILDLLAQHKTTQVLSWHFDHIPVDELQSAVEASGIEVVFPDLYVSDRAQAMVRIRDAQCSLTGVDIAAAATGTLVFSTAAGKGRVPTVLAPVHIAVVRPHQIVARIEDWIAANRVKGMDAFRQKANYCFISGPSRTGDIEMELILGVHGPGVVHIVIVQ